MPVSSRRRGGPDPDPAPLGVYVKPGLDGPPLRRTAATPSEAVALLFDGWQPDGSTSTSDPTTIPSTD